MYTIILAIHLMGFLDLSVNKKEKEEREKMEDAETDDEEVD